MKKMIVTGQMRSGTTFFANFLNSQDKIVCYADFIRSPFKSVKKLGIKDYSKELSEREKNILYAGFKAECDLFVIPIYENFSRNDFNCFKDFLKNCYNSLAAYSDKEDLGVVGNKMTHYEQQLFKLLNEDYIIFYLTRDPRDVMLSSENRFANHNTALKILEWKKAYDFVRKYKHPNLIKISFEKLIMKDEALINKLENKLETELNFDLDQLSLRDKVDYKENSSFSDVNQLFDQSAIHRWKKNLENNTVKLTDRILGKEIMQLGYESTDLSIPHSILLSYYKTVTLNKTKKAVKSLLRF